MNPNLKARFVELASDLPILLDKSRHVRQLVYGKQLIESGITSVEGKPTDPNKKYLAEVPNTIDHVKYLTEQWKKGRTPEEKEIRIANYCSTIKKLYDKPKAISD